MSSRTVLSAKFSCRDTPVEGSENVLLLGVRKEGGKKKIHVWGCSSFLCPFSHFAFINSVASKEMLSGWEFVVTHSNMNALTITKSIWFFHQYSAG